MMIGSAVSRSTCPKTRKGLDVDQSNATIAFSTPVTALKSKPAIQLQLGSSQTPSVATTLKEQLPSRPRPTSKAPQSGRDASGGSLTQSRAPLLPPPAVRCESQPISASSVLASDHSEHTTLKPTIPKHTTSKQSSSRQSSVKMAPTDRRMSITSLLSNTSASPTATEVRSEFFDSLAYNGTQPLDRSMPIHLPPLTQAIKSTANHTNQLADPYCASTSAQDTYEFPSNPLTDPALWSLQRRSSATLKPKSDLRMVSTGCWKTSQEGPRQEHHRSSRHSGHPYAIAPSYPAPGQEIEQRSPAQASSLPGHLEWSLQIRQHPVAVRACGFGDRDRRVIDPPPIVELQIHNRLTGEPESDDGVFFVSCTLLNEDGTADAMQLIDQSQWVRPTVSKDCLIGSLVTSPFEGIDDNGTPGRFFIFSDLSCRMQGAYRLHFCLLRLRPGPMMNGSVNHNAGTIVSDVFTSHTAKDFPGMMPSTPLVRALKTQGLNIVVRAGVANRARVRAKGSGMKDLAREMGTVGRVRVQSAASKEFSVREDDDDDNSPSEEDTNSEVDGDGGYDDHNVDPHLSHSRRLPLPIGSSSGCLRPVRGGR